MSLDHNWPLESSVRNFVSLSMNVRRACLDKHLENMDQQFSLPQWLFSFRSSSDRISWKAHKVQNRMTMGASWARVIKIQTKSRPRNHYWVQTYPCFIKPWLRIHYLSMKMDGLARIRSAALGFILASLNQESRSGDWWSMDLIEEAECLAENSSYKCDAFVIIR